MGIVHQEQRDPVILRDIASRHILPIAQKIREAKGAIVHDAQKSRRTAPVLHVRPAGFGDRGEIEPVAPPEMN